MNSILKMIVIIITCVLLSMLAYVLDSWGTVIIYLLVNIIFELEEIKDD